MKDFIGKDLYVGDHIIFINHSKTSSCLNEGYVVRFTNTMVVTDKIFLNKNVKVKPEKVVKINE